MLGKAAFVLAVAVCSSLATGTAAIAAPSAGGSSSSSHGVLGTEAASPGPNFQICRMPNRLFDNPDDRTTYYACDSMFVPHVLPCQPGTIFHGSLQACDFPKNVPGSYKDESGVALSLPYVVTLG